MAWCRSLSPRRAGAKWTIEVGRFKREPECALCDQPARYGQCQSAVMFPPRWSRQAERTDRQRAEITRPRTLEALTVSSHDRGVASRPCASTIAQAKRIEAQEPTNGVVQ